MRLGMTTWQPQQAHNPPLARERLFQISQRVGGHRDDRRVLREFVRNNLVQGIGRGVVIMKVGPVVLDRAEARHALFREGPMSAPPACSLKFKRPAPESCKIFATGSSNAFAAFVE